MSALADLLIITLVAYISYQVGYFIGIHDYVQMVERWSEKEKEKEKENG
jgi:uncharacterized membrane protein YoaT (DUF817 family)